MDHIGCPCYSFVKKFRGYDSIDSLLKFWHFRVFQKHSKTPVSACSMKSLSLSHDTQALTCRALSGRVIIGAICWFMVPVMSSVGKGIITQTVDSLLYVKTMV